MIRAATLAAVVVAAAAGMFGVASSAGTPPPLVARIAVSHARPAAGHEFVGVTVLPLSVVEQVGCVGLIRGANLRARLQRFYTDGIAGPSAVTCGWKIPASARGSLSTQVTVVTDDGTIVAPVVSWRIRR